jgi:hypothetical protein
MIPIINLILKVKMVFFILIYNLRSNNLSKLGLDKINS